VYAKRVSKESEKGVYFVICDVNWNTESVKGSERLGVVTSGSAGSFSFDRD
jgi:hypothetical protein